MSVFGKKGIASWIMHMIMALLVLGAMAFLYFLMIGRYFDIHLIVSSNEAQRHAINVAQVLLSSDKLVMEEKLTDGSLRYHRAVFDREKLKMQMMDSETYDGSGNLVMKVSKVSEEIGYPNTGTSVVVTDIETGEVWALASTGPGFTNAGQYLGCLANELKTNILEGKWTFGGVSLPGLGGMIPLPWNQWNTQVCADTYADKIGTYSKDFPVIIYNNGAYHAGRLFVSVFEL